MTNEAIVLISNLFLFLIIVVLLNLVTRFLKMGLKESLVGQKLNGKEVINGVGTFLTPSSYNFYESLIVLIYFSFSFMGLILVKDNFITSFLTSESSALTLSRIDIDTLVIFTGIWFVLRIGMHIVLDRTKEVISLVQLEKSFISVFAFIIVCFLMSDINQLFSNSDRYSDRFILLISFFLLGMQYFVSTMHLTSREKTNATQVEFSEKSFLNLLCKLSDRLVSFVFVCYFISFFVSGFINSILEVLHFDKMSSLYRYTLLFAGTTICCVFIDNRKNFSVIHFRNKFRFLTLRTTTSVLILSYCGVLIMKALSI